MSPVPGFNELLVRADEELLQRLLGRPTVKLMQATLGRQLTTARMRLALQEIRPPHELLEDPSTRQLLFELLRPEEASRLSAQVLGVTAPTEVLCARCGPRSSSFNRLLDALEVNRPLSVEATEPPPSSVVCDPTYALFPHQLAAMHKVLVALAMHPHRVMLHMPTGSGKTRTAMQVATHHLRQPDSTTVVWLATSEELCEQAAEEFEQAWRYGGDRQVLLLRAWGPHQVDSEQLFAPGPKLVVAGLAKLHAARLTNQTLLPRLGDQVSLVIFDEAHQSIAETYKSVVNVLLARNTDARLLGLSATPGRSWDDPAADAELSSYFGREKVMLEVPGYRSPISYLIEQGYLARPIFRRLEYHSTTELTEAEIRCLADALDVSEELRARLADDDLRNLLVVRECERLLVNHNRLLVFAASVAHADLLAVVLRGLGVAAYSVTGRSRASERTRYINWYRASDPEPRVLVNFGILTTGFDAPKTSSALIARPTKSLVLYSQMIGRAMRGPRAGGNELAEIVTVIDTSLPGFGDPAAAFENWEDVW